MTESQVTYYFLPDSPHCQKMKDYLDQRGLTVTEIDISNDDRAKQNLLEQSGQIGVPCLIFTNQAKKTKVIIGFDRDVLDRELPD